MDGAFAAEDAEGVFYERISPLLQKRVLGASFILQEAQALRRGAAQRSTMLQFTLIGASNP
jgi:hypothetical protein